VRSPCTLRNYVAAAWVYTTVLVEMDEILQPGNIHVEKSELPLHISLPTLNLSKTGRNNWTPSQAAQWINAVTAWHMNVVLSPS